MEVEEAPGVEEQQVPRVEVDVSGLEDVPQELLLRLGLVPSIAQEAVDGSERSHQ